MIVCSAIAAFSDEGCSTFWGAPLGQETLQTLAVKSSGFGWGAVDWLTKSIGSIKAEPLIYDSLALVQDYKCQVRTNSQKGSGQSPASTLLWRLLAESPRKVALHSANPQIQELFRTLTLETRKHFLHPLLIIVLAFPLILISVSGLRHRNA